MGFGVSKISSKIGMMDLCNWFSNRDYLSIMLELDFGKYQSSI
jgi:hypothetical protein